MRKMITSKKEQQLLDMTESVIESGVWVIPSGTTGMGKELKKLESGYQYKIYLNIKGTAVHISRTETEIGVTEDFINFIDSKTLEFMTSTSMDGDSYYRLALKKNTSKLLNAELRFSDATTSEVMFRYLITRSKLYF